ncbi:TIGR01620 family protein [Shewanella dokdonensis]|uniref:TIGR01620 family protein n=1 Tax=Shewanella dokdonensis TaxID=712036 RepID=A0ABX8DDT3_9GAMM|nr:TIGR01620 family protein [Shewanella dokdonensis]QVK22860.1 TIGR01620 family protein [Shewanella dokdonensis]
MPSSAATAIRQLESLLSVEQNDAEQVMLFESIVLRQRDAAARKIVHHFAAESALLLAISPFAVLDMALVLWRNQKMLSRIAECYGIKLGYWSRIRLFRGILLNILYAGTTELAMDIGNQLLSVELTGKLSARLGQGLGAGLLTARLGYQAMSLCRPLALMISPDRGYPAFIKSYCWNCSSCGKRRSRLRMKNSKIVIGR